MGQPDKMGGQQGLARLLASSGLYRILVLALLLTAILVLVRPLMNNGASHSSQSSQSSGSSLELSENSELGRFVDGLIEKKFKEYQTKIKKRQDTLAVAAKTAAVVDPTNLRFDDLPPFNEYWSKILHFIPQKNNENCMSLFTTETSKDIKVDPGFLKLRDESHMKDFAGRYAPQHDKLTMLYQELAQQKFVKTVCEIGFNVGQSAIAWLSAKPGIMYYGFDIGLNDEPQKVGAHLEKLFPKNFKLTIGDSTKTVPAWLEEGVKCDIVAIDGGHEYPIVIQDIHNMRKAAAKEHIIVLDDIYYPGVNKAWKEVTQSGEVAHLFDCWLPGMDIDVAIGYYKPKN